MSTQFEALTRAGERIPYGHRYYGGKEQGTVFQLKTDRPTSAFTCFFDEVGHIWPCAEMQAAVAACRTVKGAS